MLDHTISKLADSLDANRTSVAWTLALTCTALLAVSAQYSWHNYDSYWLLRTGMDWLRDGLSPWVDHYSFTRFEERVFGGRYLFGAGYAGMVMLFGEEYGAYAMRLTAYLLTLGLMLAWMKQIKAPTIAYIVALPLLVVALQQRPLIRPEMLSYPLMILAFMLYQRAREDFGWRTVVPIVVLMVLWTNYHSSIFGWVIFFGFFADIGYRLLMERAPIKKWLYWFGLGMAVLFSGYLNPDFYHPIRAMLGFPAEWKTIISEYKPPFDFFGNPSFYVFVAATLVTLLLSLRQRKIGYLVILVIFLKTTTTTARMISPTTILCMAMLVHVIADARRDAMLKNWPMPAKYVAGIVAVLAFLVPMFRAVDLAYAFATKEIRAETLYPNHLVAYMQEQNENGRIFNEYHLGGYLLYHLAPDSKVYIDGRTAILYPLDFTRNYFEAKKTAVGLIGEFEKYDVEYAVLANRIANARNLSYADFRLEFSDQDYSLFKRSTGRLENMGRLWALPYCWDASNAPAYVAEARLIGDGRYPGGDIQPLSSAVVGYLNAVSRPDFLRTLVLRFEDPDSVKRFAGYRAIEVGEYEAALNAFSKLRSWEMRDTLAVSFAYFGLGDYLSAYQEQVRAIRHAPVEVEFTDLVFQQELLTRLGRHVTFDEYIETYLNSLTRTVGDNNLSSTGEAFDVSFFCPPGS